LRPDGRASDELRPVSIRLGYLAYAEGSALIEMGQTKVICAASVEERVPPFLLGQGQGWVTAEYSLLPRSTQARTPRESLTGRPSGRTQEVSRFIGRSLRAAVDLKGLGERTITIDCDVIQADGGTRVAAITGGYVALAQAVDRLIRQGSAYRRALWRQVAAVSVGLVGGEALLDLCYQEDCTAETDFNVVMTASGRLVEIQGTAEGEPFSRDEMEELLDLAWKGIGELLSIQMEALRGT